MSYKRVESLGDVQRFGLLVILICEGCQRQRIIAPRMLMRRFHAGTFLRDIGAKLRCRGQDIEGGGCGHRGAIVRLYDPPKPPPPEPDDDGPGGNVLPMPLPRPIDAAAPAYFPARRRARR
ncbi:hypothetical protein [Sphingomonas hylomeconis]|uniref:Uncharacterized protein n=1 Tax=Sphingomonas hylomeconis TaxID=1395958 RepID=A0ABV7SRM3_9SPHN|nr:hypothetical protein [Sphingomonas hylomeconis]